MIGFDMAAAFPKYINLRRGACPGVGRMQSMETGQHSHHVLSSSKQLLASF